MHQTRSQLEAAAERGMLWMHGDVISWRAMAADLERSIIERTTYSLRQHDCLHYQPDLPTVKYQRGN